jgi:hypothetical protein
MLHNESRDRKEENQESREIAERERERERENIKERSKDREGGSEGIRGPVPPCIRDEAPGGGPYVDSAGSIGS